MGLKAKKDNGEIIYSWNVKNREKFKCCFCGDELIFVNATMKIKHFRHKKNPDCFNSEPETIEHMQMKKWCCDKFNGDPEIKIGNRIADVMIKPNIIIECQCSIISFNEIKQRTKDYNRNGYFVLWLFGGKWKKYLLEGMMKVSPSLKEIHKLYYGRIYFLKIPEGIFPLHLESVKKWVDYSEWYTPEAEHMEVGGYYKWMKNTKRILIGGKINNFLILKIENNKLKIARFYDKKIKSYEVDNGYKN